MLGARARFGRRELETFRPAVGSAFVGAFRRSG